jgi:hypothetical protein
MVETLEPVELKIPAQLRCLAPIAYEDLIRMGDKNDGGYVIPRSIVRETELLISFGIGDNWSFDAEFLALNPALSIHAYDPTISYAHYRDGFVLAAMKLVLGGKVKIAEVRDRFHILREYRRFFHGKVRHFEERISKYKTASYETTVETVFGRADSERVFLKVDIEGAEYKVIDDFVKCAPHIIGMVVEFHDTDPLRSVFVDSVQKLRRVYEIVHVHANNFGSVSADGVPDILEMTLLRKELCGQAGERLRLPIDGLDAPNDPEKADYVLTFGS